MEIGIDGFAAACDDTSLAQNPADRINELVEKIIRHSEALAGVARITFQMNASSLPHAKLIGAVHVDRFALCLDDAERAAIAR